MCRLGMRWESSKCGKNLMMSGLIQMSEAHIMPVFPSIELHVTAAMPDSKGLLIMSSILDT
jgi:hypothetical protein